MNYNESLAYLDSLGKFGIKLGMERIEALLKELDNPQDKFKSVHVTGTNGKGSVSSMIANILLAGNLKTGKFISPHLVKYNERISINNNDITDEAFALVISAVKQAADSIVAKGVCEQPTQFEVLTAAAILHFALEKDDYETVGKKMYETHHGMSKLYEVSCEELDFLNDCAKEYGVTGSRVMGGGFGGCTINLVKNELYDNFVEKTKAAFKAKFGRSPKVYDVVIGDGSRRLE